MTKPLITPYDLGYRDATLGFPYIPEYFIRQWQIDKYTLGYKKGQADREKHAATARSTGVAGDVDGKEG